MVFKPDGKPDWTMIIALVAVAGMVGGGVWWGATLSSASATHEAQIIAIQTNFNTQMSAIQATLTGQETLIQSESVLLSKLGQKLDDMAASLDVSRPGK